MVNAIGCTGACFRWAMDLLSCWRIAILPLEFSGETRDCVELTCSEFNVYGCAMMKLQQWDCLLHYLDSLPETDEWPMNS